MKNQQAELNSQAIFELQLRLGSEIIPIQVLGSDDRHSLTDRVCREHRIDVRYRQLIQNKILDALGKILQSEATAETLSIKIQKFMDMNRETFRMADDEAEVNRASQITLPLSYQRYLDGSNNTYESNKVKIQEDDSEKEHKIEQNNQDLKNIDQNVYPSPKTDEIKHKRTGVPPPTPSKVNRTNEDTAANIHKSAKSSANSKTKWHPTGEPSQFDKDLLTAYKTVYTKCKNPQMKQMVKKIIAELQTKQHNSQSFFNNPTKVKPFTELNNSSYLKNLNNYRRQSRSRSKSSLQMNYPTPAEPPKPVPQQTKTHERKLPPRPIQPQYNYEVDRKAHNTLRNGLKSNPFNEAKEYRQPVEGVYERRYSRKLSETGKGLNRQTSFQIPKSRNSLSKYISQSDYAARQAVSAQYFVQKDRISVPTVSVNTPKAYVTAKLTITKPQRTVQFSSPETSAQYPVQRTVFNVNIERNNSRDRIGMNTSFEQVSSTLPLTTYTFSKQQPSKQQRRFKYLQQQSY